MNTPTRVKTLTHLATAAALLAAGIVTTLPAQAAPERTRIIDTTWVLEDNPHIHITFTREGDYGNLGCNNARGDIRFRKNNKDHGTYRSGPWATTRKQCDDTTMRQEAHVHNILRSKGTWTRNGATLTLSSNAGTLTFAAQPTHNHR